MARKRIGPPHAHLDAPCTDACYEELTCPAGVPSDFDNHLAGVLRHDDGTFCGHISPLSLHAQLSELALRQAAVHVRAARPGIEPHTALAVIHALVAMGWVPPQLRAGYDDRTLDKVRAGLRKFDPFLDEEGMTGIISAIQNEGILFRERTP